MEKVYGEASLESDDVITQAAGQPAAEQIIDKYIQAIGGAQQLDNLKSYIAKGSSVSPDLRMAGWARCHSAKRCANKCPD
jgi:hypothetical protein